MSTEDNIIKFENGEDETLVFDKVKTILDSEKTSKKYSTFYLSNLSLDLRLKILEYVFNDYEIENPTLLLNVIFLIRAYNEFSNDFFNDKRIIFNNITEVLDAKLKLKAVITKLITDLTVWYLSIFTCAHKVEFNFLEEQQDIPKMFQKIITTQDFITLSGIICKAKSFNATDFKLVKNANTYLQILSEKFTTTFKLANKIFEIIGK